MRDMSCGRDIDTLRCRDMELCELVICALRARKDALNARLCRAYHAVKDGISRKPLAFYITRNSLRYITPRMRTFSPPTNQNLNGAIYEQSIKMDMERGLCGA